MSDEEIPPLHLDGVRFRDALTYTAQSYAFRAQLIEKDYYCSLVLRDLAPLFGAELVFKGGTSLSKVHSDFFRLSEDLDFSISIAPDASLADRRKAAAPFKALFADIVARSVCFRVADELRGHNHNRQYNARLAYRSAVSGEDEYLKIEVALREPVIHAVPRLPARTLLSDPNTGTHVIAPFDVQVLTCQEAYAEKVRAALTRREPAIRDFFDVDNAIQRGLLLLDDTDFIDLLRRKLAMTDNVVNLSSARVEALRTQLEAELRPVLRQHDFEAFLLDRVLTQLHDVAGRVGA